MCKRTCLGQLAVAAPFSTAERSVADLPTADDLA
jgi:hypothetical protein